MSIRLAAALVSLSLFILALGCAGSSTPPVREEKRIAATQQTAPPANSPSSSGVVQTQAGALVPEGIASWYGGTYHGKKTASGEVFNKEDMTAAHKTLRFGTRLRVTNTESGATVIVRINDRQPDIAVNRNRVIDLSEGAFRRLAPTARGLVPVKLEIVD